MQARVPSGRRQHHIRIAGGHVPTLNSLHPEDRIFTGLPLHAMGIRRPTSPFVCGHAKHGPDHHLGKSSLKVPQHQLFRSTSSIASLKDWGVQHFKRGGGLTLPLSRRAAQQACPFSCRPSKSVARTSRGGMLRLAGWFRQGHTCSWV